MFFGINSRSTSPEIALHGGRDQTLYLIPKAWAFTPNVYDDRAGYTNAFIVMSLRRSSKLKNLNLLMLLCYNREV